MKNRFSLSLLLFSLLLLLLSSPFGKSAMATPLPSQYTELLSYIVPSPDQGKSDSCLYMAATGAVEILANKYFQVINPAPNSTYDFAERYAVTGPLHDDRSWFENPVLRFNSGAIRNKDLPYSARRFWKQKLPRAQKIQLPTIQTHWFLTGDTEDEKEKDGRFTVAVWTDKEITAIKKNLVNYRSPVVITHRTAGWDRGYGYWNTWHTFVIVGYDDEAILDEECPTTMLTLKHIGSVSQRKIKAALERQGGCTHKGAFYVRDSENSLPGQSRVPRYVLISYDDIRILGNNAMVVFMPEMLERQ